MPDWTSMLQALGEPAAWLGPDTVCVNRAWRDAQRLPRDAEALRQLTVGLCRAEPTEHETPFGRLACAPAGEGWLLRVLAGPEAVRADLDASVYRSLFDVITDGLFLYDDAMRLVDLNPAASRMHGWPRDVMLRMDPREFIHPASHPVFVDFVTTLRTEASFEGIATGLRADGSTFEVAVHGVPVQLHGRRHYLGTLREIAPLRELHHRLTQAQRLEGLGRMAGGVAHDFNNLLTVLLATVGLASERLPSDHEAQADLRTALQAALHARQITDRLLTFSRQRVLDLRDIDLHHALAELEPVLRRLVPAGIRWRYQAPPGLGTVRLAAGDLEQLLLNLVVNAAEAMPDGGALEVKAERQGHTVVLTVSDTGVGIHPEHLPRLFEPFYTTRRHQGGSGLGLATVHGIVEQARGQLEVRSELGTGTTFRLTLPCDHGQAPESTSSPRPREGRRQVLLAEDDPTIRRLVRVLLERHGTEVVAVASYAEAEAWLQRHGPPGLLVTDLMLGDGSGLELTEAARAIDPELQVLWLSGQAPEPTERPADVRFLAKPFSRGELLAAVDEALGLTSTPAA